MGDEDHQLQYKISALMQYLSIYTKVSGGFEDRALVMPQQQNGRMVYLVVRVRALQSQVCGFKSWSLPSGHAKVPLRSDLSSSSTLYIL